MNLEALIRSCNELEKRIKRVGEFNGGSLTSLVAEMTFQLGSIRAAAGITKPSTPNPN